MDSGKIIVFYHKAGATSGGSRRTLATDSGWVASMDAMDTNGAWVGMTHHPDGIMAASFTSNRGIRSLPRQCSAEPTGELLVHPS